MFNDELPSTFKKMYEFSVVDGFVEITESSSDMIKYIANEPSVGLYYVQQHTQNAVPNLINLKNIVDNKSRELAFHTEDMEDSVSMVSSMKDKGFPIVDDMINDIKKSLSVMSLKQPKRGLINRSSSGFQIGKISSWGPAINTREDNESSGLSGNYLASVFKSAKERASNLKWAQVDLNDGRFTSEKVTSCDDSGDGDSSNHNLLPIPENFDEFKADREAKLEDWLGETKDQDDKV